MRREEEPDLLRISILQIQFVLTERIKIEITVAPSLRRNEPIQNLKYHTIHHLEDFQHVAPSR